MNWEPIFNWNTIVPIFQCIAAVGTIAAASAAWYTARLNKQSSDRIEKQAKQAEADKHAAVKPIFSCEGLTKGFIKNGSIEYFVYRSGFKGFYDLTFFCKTENGKKEIPYEKVSDNEYHLEISVDDLYNSNLLVDPNVQSFKLVVCYSNIYGKGYKEECSYNFPEILEQVTRFDGRKIEDLRKKYFH